MLQQYVSDHVDEARSLLETLAQIPAPSGKEQARAVFCRDWLHKQGAVQAYIDEACNVICPVGVTDHQPLVVICAHSDVVFPDTEPLALHEIDGRLCCPGIGDDTANAVALLMAVKCVTERALIPQEQGILFVIDSCEEGLGNLKGIKHVMSVFGDRVSEFISFDCHADELIDDAVGSCRFLVEVDKVGGHSYFDYGNENAIATLSLIITQLYAMQIPAEGTTFNVGQIEGGTSVNTIAQHAQMLFEIRSDDRAHLAFMQAQFEAVLKAYTGVTVTTLGERPCAGDVNAARQQALVARVSRSIRQCFGFDPVIKAGSTDCNVPLSMGIPAVCFGCILGGGMHTREEYVELASLSNGLRLALEVVSFYFK